SASFALPWQWRTYPQSATDSMGFPAPPLAQPAPQPENLRPSPTPLPPSSAPCDSSSRIHPPGNGLPQPSRLSKRFASNVLHTNMQVWALGRCIGVTLL